MPPKYPLAAGMKPLMYRFEAVTVNMGVNLSGGDIGVAEHHLDGAQVRTTRQQVGGEGMAQHVRADFSADPGALGCLPDDLPEAVSGHCCSAIGAEQYRAGFTLEQQWPSPVEVVADRRPGNGGKGDDPLLVAFAEDTDMTAGQAAAVHREAHQFGHPQS